MVVAASPAAAQQNIRTATSWPGGVHLEQFAQGFSKQVDSITGGKVKFQVFPAGTIGSPLKITESVQKKVAQAGHSWPGYDWGLDKTAAVFGGEADFLEQFLHYRLQPAGADILERFVDLGGNAGQRRDAVLVDEAEAHGSSTLAMAASDRPAQRRAGGGWARAARGWKA